MTTIEACVNCSTPIPLDSRFCSKCGTPVPGHEIPTLTPQGREIYDRLVQATEGHYEIRAELGRGGMAVVFLGFQKSLAREVAIKVLLPLLGYDPALVQRFMREARTQGRLEHPNIISVYEVYDQGGLTFFSMPYVSGNSLRSFLQTTPRPPIKTVIRFLSQAADALGYAHRQGVIHRDVKPDNIMIAEDRDAVVLTDFGIAKAVSSATTLTSAGDLLGTPLYMSPEQGEGRKDLDGRADQYSLGLIGYEMLVGEPAFKADNLAELMYKHRFEDPESVHERCPDAPQHLLDAICRAIAKVPEERFPDMQALIAGLEGRAEVEKIETTAAGGPQRPDEEVAPTLRIVTPDSLKSIPPSRAAARMQGESKQPPASAATLDEEATLAVGAVRATPRRFPLGLGLGGLGVAAAATIFWFTLGPGRSGDGGQEMAFQPATTSQAGTADDATPAAVDPTGAGTANRGAGESPQGGGGDAGGDAGGEPRPVADGGEISGEDEGTIPTVVPPGDSDAERGQALRAQARVQGSREAAISAGAREVAGDRFAELERQLQVADRDMNAERFAAALTVYSALIQTYNALAGDARSTLAARLGAIAARDAAETQRREALAAGAEESAGDRLSQLDGDLAAAQGLFDQRNYAAAASRYQDAAAGFGALAVQLATPAGGDAEGEVETGDESTVEAPVLTAEESIAVLIERFRALFEGEDKAGLGSELYRGSIPGRDDAVLNAVFDRAEELRVTSRTEKLEIDGDQAKARIVLDMSFKQSRTGRPGQRNLKLELQFASDPDGWRLVRLRAR